MNCLGSRERAKSSRKLRYLGQKEKYTDDDFVADINSTLGNPINGSKLQGQIKTLPNIEIRHNCQPSANGFLAKFLRKMSNEP